MIDGFLAEANGECRARGDQLCQAFGFFQLRSGRHDAIDQPHPLGVDGAHGFAGEHRLHRTDLSRGSGPALRAPGPRNDPDLHLGLTELGRLRGHHQVAHQRQFASTAERVTTDGGDHRLVDRPKSGPAREVVILEHLDRARLGHLRDVGPGREGAVIAGEDHAANGVIAIECFQRIDQLGDGLMIERVANLRPVDRHDADRAICLGEDELVRHHSLLARPKSSPPPCLGPRQPRARSPL